MRVAIDGSPLIWQPNSPSSLHLIEWLIVLDRAGTEIALLYPNGNLPDIPAQIIKRPTARQQSTWDRIRYEQRSVPRMAGELEADLLLVGEGRAPLASPCPFAVISSLEGGIEARGLGDALALAAGRAGSRGASAKLFPSDVGSRSDPEFAAYSPFVALDFGEGEVDGQEPYVLCYGFERKDIPLILSAWTWVDGSLGDSYPLLFLGPDNPLIADIDALADDLDIAASVRTQPELSYEDLPRVYRGAVAYLGTAFAAGGQALRWALAAGVPAVGLKTPEFEAVLGEAAYLIPPGDSRSLGAACLTVLIQERVSEPLREKGIQRARKYLGANIEKELVDLLAEIAELGREAAENGK